jgi:hypothetical protein
MKTIKVITSQSQAYYDRIGKDCLESFLEFWPKSIKIELYAEEFIPDTQNENLIVNSMENVLEKWNFYLKERDATSKRKMAKFWLKSFVLLDALENTSEDILIWLDSDVITHKQITENFLYSLLSEDDLLCDIPAKGSLKDKESETGFCMINMNHPLLSEFKKSYEFYYIDKNIKNLPREIDSSVWWAARTAVEKLGAKMNGLDSTINTHVPFMGTILKDYMRHWVTKANKINYEKKLLSVTYEEQGLRGDYHKNTDTVTTRKLYD